MQIDTITIALGSNQAGPWGHPRTIMQRAVEEIKCLGIIVISRSDTQMTAPMGRVRQPIYLNAAITIEPGMAMGTLLRELKRLERRAGRRLGVRWGPRPLDLDIVTHGGRTVNTRARHTVPGRLCVPHPGVADRTFVLSPMRQVAPAWRHPGTGLRPREMLVRLKRPIPKRRPVR